MAARRVHLPAPALVVFPEANSHLLKYEKWRLIVEEAPQGAVVLNLESSYSGCCLSRRAQFGVVVLQEFVSRRTHCVV
ncbi:hypothetical protein Taro_022280 [Colocasia esculenta]|uniref:Uncharacterized protein n=1 Tax=Colocasia esculenta TaxID=4460 RepID=A0A843V7Y5_COLES|nr:hypothetical protein [Colocasia esculenta]